MTMTVLAAAAAVLTLASACVLYVVTGRRYRRIRDEHSGQLPPDVVERLGPYLLALLAGGRRRLGELAVTRLYLEGHIRVVRRNRRLRGSLTRVARTDEGSGGTGQPSPGHPVPAAGLRAFDSQSPAHPSRVAYRAARGWWAEDALATLRQADLLLRPERLRSVRAVRRFATALHVAPAVFVGVLVHFVALSALMMVMMDGFLLEGLIGTPDGQPSPFVAVVPLMFVSSLYVLMRTYIRFGVRAIVLGTAVIAVTAMPMTVLPASVSLELLGYCASWFGVYHVYVKTGGALGPRTPAGDAVVDQARENLDAADHKDGENVALAVALSGPMAAGILRSDELGSFFGDIGLTGSSSQGPDGDGGPGGAFDVHGGSDGVAGGGGFGGGDGGGGIGGDGGGGGGSGGGGGGD